MSRVLLAGGGTAGHVNPLLATAARLASKGFECSVLGTREGLEAQLVPQAGLRLDFLERVPFPRRLNRAALTFPSDLLRQVRLVMRLIRSRKIDVVVGFGGYVAAPAYLAARFTRTPLVVHEANALPGFANKLGALLTNHVATTFQNTRLRNAVRTGLPLRAEFEHAIQYMDKSQTRVELGLDPVMPTLLVMGGSLGARSINEAALAARPFLKAAGLQVFHILGARSEIDEFSEDGYITVRYSANMAELMVAADFAVARAGAATVSEFSAAGLPALYVPYAVGNGEQAHNISSLVEAGASIKVLDSEISAAVFRDQVIPIISNKKRLREMAEKTLALGLSDGTDRLVGLIEAALGKVEKR